MSDDFYPFVDSGDPAPDNAHLTGVSDALAADSAATQETSSQPDAERASYATRIAVYDDMLSTPRVIVVSPKDVRTYLEEITNTVYRCMKEQGGGISLMVIREIVENFIHADFVEPIISVLDDGNTIRFADQGPGIDDKERAFEFGVTSADRNQKRYIRGTGAGFPMVQQYLENAGGAISIEDNLHQGTVVTVTIDPVRAGEVEAAAARGAAVRSSHAHDARVPAQPAAAAAQVAPMMPQQAAYPTAQQPYQAVQQPYPAAQQPYPTGWGYPGAGTMPGAPQPWGAMPGTVPGTGAPWGVDGVAQPWGAAAPAQAWGASPSAGAAPGAPAPSAPRAGVYVSERGAQALSYLAAGGSAGPTDLAGSFGSSAPTWSRELKALAQSGLVVKHGQKWFATEAGGAWIRQQHTEGGEVTHG